MNGDINKIAFTGSSGFVATHLIDFFSKQNKEIVKITQQDLKKEPAQLAKYLDGVDLIINTAGANISQRWSEEYKKILYSSRIDTTKKIVDTIKIMDKKPSMFISTSAMGIYEDNKIHDENSNNLSTLFLGKVCKDWENEALKAKELNVDTYIFRFAVVLGNGGALKKMATPFKLGLGGPIGDGSSIFSWIYIKDLIKAYEFVIKNRPQEKLFNLCNGYLTNKDFTKALGKKFNKPTLLPVPIFVLKLIFGEGTQAIASSVGMVAKNLEKNGFKFDYPTINQALEDIKDL